MNLLDGRLLYVDLADGSSRLEDFGAYRPYIGGRAVNQLVLLRLTPRRVSPFDPQNPLAIGAGLLAGTDAPGACRLSVDSRNVLTEGDSRAPL